MNRRQFMQSAAAAPALAATTGGAVEDAVRADFPWLKESLWLSGADYHPLSVHSLRAVEEYFAWRGHGPGAGRSRFGSEQQRETKELFGRLINARPAEIAFVQTTTDGENLVISGLDLPHSKGNVVIDDLHYQASKYMYRMLRKERGVELRIVPHRGEGGSWRVDPKDMEQAIDRNTRLVSIALVSNINGYLHHVKTTSEIAHAHGALVYGDIIQAAGATPVDVRALGLDCAACGAYKWLMGDMGFGFLYVREDLQESRIRRTRYGVRQYTSPNHTQADSQFELVPGAARYESGASISNSGGVVVHAALKYIHRLGIENIRSHAKALTDRLQKELPRLGYTSITPGENPTPIVSFLTPDYEQTGARLRKAFREIPIALRRWEVTAPSGDVSIAQGMRISPSVYNNQSDIDRLLEALS